MTPIFHLIYLSVATQPFSTKDFDELLRISHRNNRVVGVTGLLVARGNVFLQLLEGAATAVRHVYNRIGTDPRHESLEIIAELTSHKRLFPRWSMGKIVDEELERRLSDFIPLLRDISESPRDSRDAIVKILREFSRKESLLAKTDVPA